MELGVGSLKFGVWNLEFGILYVDRLMDDRLKERRVQVFLFLFQKLSFAFIRCTFSLSITPKYINAKRTSHSSPFIRKKRNPAMPMSFKNSIMT